MSDRMPEDMRNKMPKDLPDRMPEDVPEDMPEHMPEDMPDRMRDRMSEDMSDRMPEDLPVRKCINVMVGITRSKVIFLSASSFFIFSWFYEFIWNLGFIRNQNIQNARWYVCSRVRIRWFAIAVSIKRPRLYLQQKQMKPGRFSRLCIKLTIEGDTQEADLCHCRLTSRLLKTLTTREVYLLMTVQNAFIPQRSKICLLQFNFLLR